MVFALHPHAVRPPCVRALPSAVCCLLSASGLPLLRHPFPGMLITCTPPAQPAPPPQPSYLHPAGPEALRRVAAAMHEAAVAAADHQPAFDTVKMRFNLGACGCGAGLPCLPILPLS